MSYFPNLSVVVLTAAATQIQAAWRGYAMRRKLPRILGVEWTRVLLFRVQAASGPREKAKAFIRARNKRIESLRSEIKQHSGSTSFLYRRRLQAELDGHMQNAKHRLRGALFLEAWWRGCRVRGWRGRHGRKLGRWQQARKGEDTSDHEGERLGSFNPFLDGGQTRLRLHGPQGEEAWSNEAWQGGDWSSSLWAPLEYMASAFTAEQESEFYAGTKVKRIPVPKVKRHSHPRKVVIFYSDTGGGHKASALALEAALKKISCDQVSVDLIDLIRHCGFGPWKWTPEAYQALGHFPWAYKKIYEADLGATNFRESTTFKLTHYFNRPALLAYIGELIVSGVDLLLSVHPLLNHLLTTTLQEIFGDHPCTVPVATVITDLGSAHTSWFEPLVDALFVPTDHLKKIAMDCGVPLRRITNCGLPIREGFWSSDPRPKSEVQKSLGLLPRERPDVILLMGGGEGFGSLFNVAVGIGESLAAAGFGQLVVVCGRNFEVRVQLEGHQWQGFSEVHPPPKILGFVPNVDEYMTAADLLVTKAGPGSIAEAMIRGLPCLLTSFVPGQEEGNVGFVEDGGVGEFVSETEPEKIAATVVRWLNDTSYLAAMSTQARSFGRPLASLDIARRICDSLLELGMEMQPPRSTAAGEQREMQPPQRVAGEQQEAATFSKTFEASTGVGATVRTAAAAMPGDSSQVQSHANGEAPRP